MLVCCTLLLAGCGTLVSGEPPVLPGPTPTEWLAVNIPTTASRATVAPSPAAPTPTPTATPWADYQPDRVSADNCSYGGAFESIEALDPFTVQFRLCRPDAAFLSKVAFPAFAIYPKEWLDQAGSAGFSVDNPIGSGAYRLAEWSRGERLVLQDFEDYRQPEKPRTREIIFRWETEMSARLIALEAGEVDGIDAVSADDFSALRSDTTKTLALRPPLSVAFLGINNQHPPFDDERVRTAIAMGIDRTRLLEEAFPEGYEPAQFFTPCIIPFGCSGNPIPAFDPAQARLMLAEAGYPDGFQTRLYYPYVVRSYMPWPNLVAQSLKKQLNDNLKIVMQPDSQLEDEFYSAVDSGAMTGLYLSGWGADYPDADNFLGEHFGPSSAPQFGEIFEDISAALDRAVSISDPAGRQQAYALANTAISQHVPAIPLAHGGWASADNRAIAFSAQVQGFQASPFGFEDFSELAFAGQDRSSFIWLQLYEPLSVFCPLAIDVESLRACTQIAETLYRYTPGSASVEPALAQECTPDETLQTWSCNLQPQVRFHDGSILDANDVVASFAMQWDARSQLHSQGSGGFPYFRVFWPGFLNDIQP